MKVSIKNEESLKKDSFKKKVSFKNKESFKKDSYKKKVSIKKKDSIIFRDSNKYRFRVPYYCFIKEISL